MNEQDFSEGFWFHSLLVQSMGFKFDPAAEFSQLQSVANGDLTLLHSPEEALRDSLAAWGMTESMLGRPLTDEELEEWKTFLPKNRAQRDARNKELARLMLGVLEKLEKLSENESGQE